MDGILFQQVLLTSIGRCPWQPRREFSGPEFDELVASVAKQGVLEPVLVRKVEGPYLENCPHFPTAGRMVDLQLMAGERRFRAAWAVAEENGGVESGRIPAMVRVLSDDEAFDIMTIENLHRKDLNELEEAFNFQAYLDRHGASDKVAEELAGRIGKSARYVRRRVRLLTLPEEVLGAWSQGKIAYGYLDQLVRIADNPERVKAYAQEILKGEWKFQTVKDLKEAIDSSSPKLATAAWNVKKTCAACASNSRVQAEQFGDQHGDKAAHCLDPACFKDLQGQYLTQNWLKSPLHDQHGTRGFVFREDCPWNKGNQFYGSLKPGKKCKDGCADFVTVLHLDGTMSQGQGQVCIGKSSCFAEQTKSKSRPSGGSNFSGPSRGFYRREHLANAWLQDRVKAAFAAVDGSDVRVKRLQLANLVIGYSASDVQKVFFQEYRELFPKESVPDPDDDFLMIEEDVLWAACLQVPEDQLDRAIAGCFQVDIADNLSREFGAEMCELLGVDPWDGWSLTKEYLDLMEASEIHALAHEHKLWKRPECERFLYETLLKKRGAFKSCTKDELVRVILESGVDLTGVVPKEIREKMKRTG